MRDDRQAEPLALYGDYPALYCLGAKVPSSKTVGMRRGARRLVWAAVTVGIVTIASGGLYATKRFWSPEESLNAVVPSAVAPMSRPAVKLDVPVK